MTLTLTQARSWYSSDDPVHGFDHIQRVYFLARQIAEAEGADIEIVAAAALLHDAQNRLDGPEPAPDSTPLAPQQDPGPSQASQLHHLASAAFARHVLTAEGWSAERIAAVEHCIRAHRFRDDSEQPQTLEARVLFDADKLDAIGAIGVGRAITYAARRNQPIYAPPSAQFLQSGVKEAGEPHSSYHEFLFKLRRLNERLYTDTGRALGARRHQFLLDFYSQLVVEAHLEI